MTENPLTLRAITARPVDVPLKRLMRTASGVLPTAALVLVDVETEEGVTGSAYTFAYTPRMLKPMVQALDNVADLVVGKPLDPVARADDLACAFRLLGRQGLLGMALAGLDMALWDALGKAQGRSVAELLGAAPRPLQAYDSYGMVDPSADRVQLEDTLSRGFTGVKLKIGGGDLAADVDMVSGVRDIVGPDMALMVDYNQSLKATEALRRIERLAEFNLAWVEEPVPAEDLAGHAAVRAASPIPIQSGENWWFADGLATAINAGASDLVMPDIMKIGGVSGWRAAAQLAAEAGLPVSSHAFVEASAHALAATPTAHWLEFLDKAAPILQDPAQVVDGCVTARGPGLGLNWDEAAVTRYLVE